METKPPNKDNAPENDDNGGKNYYLTIDELILKVNTARNNYNHPEIAPLLLKRGYSATDMDAAGLLVSNLQTLNEKQKKEYAEQFNATETYNNDWKALNIIYSEHVELGRIVFENDLTNYVQLGLLGRRKHSFSGYMLQAQQFYNNGLKSQEIMDGLSQKGISKKEMEDTLALIGKVEEEKFKQSKETGEARQATKNRDAALDKLSDWYGKFKRTALVALSGNEALAKVLGF